MARGRAGRVAPQFADRRSSPRARDRIAGRGCPPPRPAILPWKALCGAFANWVTTASRLAPRSWRSRSAIHVRRRERALMFPALPKSGKSLTHSCKRFPSPRARAEKVRRARSQGRVAGCRSERVTACAFSHPSDSGGRRSTGDGDVCSGAPHGTALACFTCSRRIVPMRRLGARRAGKEDSPTTWMTTLPLGSPPIRTASVITR
jgi:hypothetical protein